MSGKQSTMMFVNMVAFASRASNYLSSAKMDIESPMSRDAISFSLACVGQNACAIPKYVSDIFPEVPWSQLRELSSLPFYEARSDYVKQTARDVVNLIPTFREILAKLGCDATAITRMDADTAAHRQAVGM